MTPRRFPPPWTVIENAESFWVQGCGLADLGVLKAMPRMARLGVAKEMDHGTKGLSCQGRAM